MLNRLFSLRIPTDHGNNNAFGNGVSIPNGYDDDANGRKKSVHFAESKSLPASESVASHSNGSISPVLSKLLLARVGISGQVVPLVKLFTDSYQSSPMGSTPPSGVSPILALNPSDEVVFAMNSQGDLVAKVVVSNISFKSIAYKVNSKSFIYKTILACNSYQEDNEKS